MQTQFRWKNFRCFSDTGWVDVKPLTLVIGANNSGKSSLIAPLLMMKQTLDSADDNTPLMTKGPLINVGSYKDFIHNHDVDKSLSLDVKTHYHPNESPKKNSEVGDSAPGEFVSYFQTTNQLFPKDFELARYIVKDPYGRVIFSRIRDQRNSFTLNFRPKKTISSDSRKEILDDKPKHFFFTDDAIHKLLRKRARRLSSKKKELNISEGELIYFASVSAMVEQIQELFSNISYLGPLREPFKRLYEFSGEHPQNIGVRGEYAPELIARGITPQQRKWINNWTEKFDFGGKLQSRSNEDNKAFFLELKQSRNTVLGNLFDTGSGLSQVLPLIVEGTRAPKDSLIVCEQPEIHLNPKLQVLLADLFVETANLEKNMIIETHSEHLLLRLRRLIAEGRIDHKNVSILFVEKKTVGSQVRNILIGENGHIAESDWPVGFFAESLREAMELSITQSKSARKNGKRNSS